jgi:1-acyl-sn-glycerol-3-phosphate acyltransferase
MKATLLTPDALSTISRQARTSMIMFPAIGVFLAHGTALSLGVRERRRRLEITTSNLGRYARFALKTMRLKVAVTGNDDCLFEDNYLVVCNHLSYLDMMVLAAVYPSVFVTSVDMGEVPFLGHMAEAAGSLFIERRNRDRVEKDIDQISEVLGMGLHVTLFPEGTSTNGESVLPFKKSLLQAAARANKSILPVTLNYTDIDGRPVSIDNRDTVCWYGDMKFLPHLMKVFEKRAIRAEVRFHEPIRPESTHDRDSIARAAHEAVAKSYVPPMR